MKPYQYALALVIGAITVLALAFVALKEIRSAIDAWNDATSVAELVRNMWDSAPGWFFIFLVIGLGNLASIWVWPLFKHHVTGKVGQIISRSAAIEILFDPVNNMCARQRARDGELVTQYYVGIRNNSDRTIHDVVVVVTGDEPFVSEVFHRWLPPAPYADWERIDPDVTQWLGLFGVGETSMARISENYGTPVQFQIEVRARDTRRAILVFEFDPNKVPAIYQKLGRID
jgi:hypothetical protein